MILSEFPGNQYQLPGNYRGFLSGRLGGKRFGG